MIYNSQEKSLLLLLFCSILLVSCSLKNENLNTRIYIKKEVDLSSKATLTVNFSTNKLNIKSNDSYNEAKISDIKSFSAFLTTDPYNPFSSSSNPMGDGVIKSTNNLTASKITFINVPVGGPYYAVVSAFDGLNGTGNNLSEPNLLLTSIDNKWYISNENVTVLPSGNIIFSNTSTTLNVDLVLRKPIAHSITSEVNILNGNSTSGDPIDVN